MSEASAPKRVTRRTVAKGAAWTVPAVVVAAPVSAAASSYIPPPPTITFDGACGNTGATQKGCGGDKTLQVPLTLTNPPGGEAYIFQIENMYTCNCTTAPTAPGAGVYSGVRGIWITPTHNVADQNNCTAPTYVTSCSGGVTNGSIMIPANATPATTTYRFWIESAVTQDSSTFSTYINWRLLSGDGQCTILRDSSTQTASAISSANCDGKR